jgi:hypothetical protein
MSEPDRAVVPLGTLPDGYQEILYWTVTAKSGRFLLMQLLAVPLLVLFGGFYSWLGVQISGDLFASTFTLSVGDCGMFLLIAPLTLILHEFIHGVFIRIYGARPRYGVLWKQLMFYATSPGYAFRRNSYLVIALAPLIVLSLLAIIGMICLAGTGWMVLIGLGAVLNGSGAIGDLWIALKVLGYPEEAYVIDERDGFRVFLPTGSSE